MLAKEMYKLQKALVENARTLQYVQVFHWLSVSIKACLSFLCYYVLMIWLSLLCEFMWIQCNSQSPSFASLPSLSRKQDLVSRSCSLMKSLKYGAKEMWNRFTRTTIFVLVYVGMIKMYATNQQIFIHCALQSTRNVAFTFFFCSM